MDKKTYLKLYPEKKDFIDKVLEDPYRLKYHLMPPSGWLNDPNGLCVINGITHIYFQYSPFTAGWDLKSWGHYSTKDYLNYIEYDPFIYPDIEEDRHGAYSGSAFVEDGIIHYFYTGNVKYTDKEYNYNFEGREQNTIYFNSKDGINISEKKVVLKNEDYPDFVGVHVRDPKVVKENGIYYMILGARSLDDEGCALIFRSENLLDWKYHFKIETREKFGYMWECPDLVKIENQYFLMISPQGVEQKGYDFANVYQVGYFKLDIDFENKTYMLGKFYELDRGFDIYAPQTYKKENKVILYGWMGIPDAKYHNQVTVQYNWIHALTLPRELRVKDDRITQHVLSEIESNTFNLKSYKVTEKEEILPNETYVAEMIFNQQDHFEIKLGYDIILEYKDKVCSLKMDESGLGRDFRAVEIQQIEKIKIYKDTSSIEIFINDGEEVFTSRVYPKSNTLTIKANCECYISEMKPFNYIKR